MPMSDAQRTLVAWCPDWSVRAAGADPGVPVAVVAANRVVSTTPAARVEGVVSGLRRREAQSRCPDLEVLDADRGRDARVFEVVATAVEAFTPGVEIVRPGVVALATRGPSRYFGGDEALAVEVAAAVDAALGGAAAGAVDAPGWIGCRVGLADGRFAAGWAARVGASVVPPGGSRAFLGPLPVSTLPDRQLAGVLLRLAVATLGDLAALPEAKVLARFGRSGALAHRLARGLDDHPLAVRTPPPDLTVAAELDPPATRVDTAAFVVRTLATELQERLSRQGLACTRVVVEAESEHGERLSRRWRHEGALGAAAIAERARWQLEGWIEGGRVTGGLIRLQLVPDEVAPDGGNQLGFWGGAAGDGRVVRSLARVQGLLGPDSVLVAVPAGGREPAAQVRLVPWGEAPLPLPGAAGCPGAAPWPGRPGAAPWPGRLPGPQPALVPAQPLPAVVEDATGVEVTVGGRGLPSAAPDRLAVAGGPPEEVVAWAGPWPLQERWWEGERRRARFQLVTAAGVAYLASREGGRWWVEAVYD